MGFVLKAIGLFVGLVVLSTGVGVCSTPSNKPLPQQSPPQTAVSGPVNINYSAIEEFNGVRWRSKFPRQGFKLLLRDDAVKLRFYIKSTPDNLYGIPVTKIVYTVDKGVFNKAHAELDESSYNKVRRYLYSNYGQPTNIANREIFSITSKGHKASAVLQPGLVNFSYY